MPRQCKNGIIYNIAFGPSGNFKELIGEIHNHDDIHGNLFIHHPKSRLAAVGIYVVPDDETRLEKKKQLGWDQGLVNMKNRKMGAMMMKPISDLPQCKVSPSSEIADYRLQRLQRWDVP